MTNSLMIVEPAVEILALVAGMTWLFHTIDRTARTRRDHIRLTIAAVAVALVTALVLEYLKFHLSKVSARLVINLGSALLLVVVGNAWLRPAILMSTGIHLPPRLLGLVPSLKHRAPAASTSDHSVMRNRVSWSTIGLAGGIIVAAVNNGDVVTTVSIPVSLALVLVSSWLAIGITAARVTPANTTLRIVAGVLLAALGSFQTSEIFNVDWHNPAAILCALIGGYLAAAYWLIGTCRGGDSRKQWRDSADTGTVSGNNRVTAGTRTRNALVTADVCIWAAAIGACLHFGWHTAIGIAEWQVGLLLFVGFILSLVHSVLVDVRLPSGG